MHDIIATNTFNSTMTSQKDYNWINHSFELNFWSKVSKKKCWDYMFKNPKISFFAGVLGPTNRTCSISIFDVNNNGFRNISFDELVKDYEVSINALIKGNVDLIMIETVFDTLNAKAALMAINKVEKKKILIPIMISATITDLSGRTLSGQTIEVFTIR